MTAGAGAGVTAGAGAGVTAGAGAGFAAGAAAFGASVAVAGAAALSFSALAMASMILALACSSPEAGMTAGAAASGLASPKMLLALVPFWWRLTRTARRMVRAKRMTAR